MTNTSLPLGDEQNAPIGAPVALIGFPLSTGIAMKFCLSGNIVAKAAFGEGPSQVNIVFFQGVPIKGISGAPIISLDTGKVIGIENLRLTGITPALEKTKKETETLYGNGTRASVSVLGINLIPTLSDIINVLDTQLANGLGAGNGISAARLAMEKARKDRKK